MSRKKFIRFDDKDFYKDVPNEVGIYKIYSLQENNIPHILRRLLKDDEEGILYICHSKKLKDRIRMLYRVLNPNDFAATAHTFGMKYRNSKILQKNFPKSTLAFTYEVDSQHEKKEKKLIKNYSEIFGEVPPLNSNSFKE